MFEPWGIPFNIFVVLLIGGPVAVFTAIVLINSRWWKAKVQKYYALSSTSSKKEAE